MAKAGMRRPDPEAPHGTEARQRNHFSKNTTNPVPEIQGKAKHGKEKARPIIEGPLSNPAKVYHQLSGNGSVGDPYSDRK